MCEAVRLYCAVQLFNLFEYRIDLGFGLQPPVPTKSTVFSPAAELLDVDTLLEEL